MFGGDDDRWPLARGVDGGGPVRATAGAPRDAGLSILPDSVGRRGNRDRVCTVIGSGSSSHDTVMMGNGQHVDVAAIGIRSVLVSIVGSVVDPDRHRGSGGVV